MRSRLELLWVRLRESLWFVPAVMTAGASILALLLLNAESSGTIDVGSDHHLAFGGTADGARELLSAVAGALMTVTGVAFSVTVVALQLSSTQFTPRVLPNFMADRANHYVLGVLIGTFTYSLLVLRVIDTGDDGRPEFIPRLSITVGILLALASIAMLIYFINHAARSIQISVILAKAAGRALDHVDTIFPEEFAEPDPVSEDDQVPPVHVCIAAPVSGYLQAIDESRIFETGRDAEAVIRIEHRIGSFVLEGEPLARAWPDGALDEEGRKSLTRAFVLGDERTHEQDYELSLIEIADIAVKALSPSVNDPTTAQHSIDRLAQLLLALAKRHSPRRIRTREGRVHVIVQDLAFDRAVESAFGQILHFASDHPVVVRRLIERLDTLIGLVPAGRRDPLVAMRRAAEERVAGG
jgi:uncharacterized membrane protein